MNIFNYLKHHDRSFIAFDPKKLDVEWDIGHQKNSPWTRVNTMKDIYPDAQGDIPPNITEPRCDSAQISLLLDTDHTGDKLPEGRRQESLFL